jgi:heat shock protein HspQ
MLDRGLTMKFDVRLGDRVKDKVSGFEGIVMAIHQWRDGTIDATVQPEGLQNGEPIKQHVMEVAQLELVAQQVLPAPTMTKPRFELGAFVVNKLLDFDGYVSCLSWYYHGCLRYHIQRPLNKDGKIPEIVGCIDSDLDLVQVEPPKNKKESKKDAQPATTGKGGPQDHSLQRL